MQVRDREEAARISNAYAPEHLIINVDDPESWLPMLDNAGSIFMGRYAAHVIKRMSCLVTAV
jgi:histidinol dehydrogenase